MAARSLGVLTLDLLMRTSGFISGATAAERATDKVTKKIRSSFGGLKGAIAGAFGGFTLAATINGIVRNTIEAEDALRQLEARIKSTGGIAGVSADELTAYASELQGLTTFSDDAIVSMNALLLSFTNIRGSTVKDATRAILDVATALGMDLNGAATLVGKALNDPVEGLSALSRAGIRFSDDQKKVIKALVDSGNVAGAQAKILRELETRYGGAAEAAADTFGGALKQLQNNFTDLLEAKGGLGEATGAVQELSDLLRDPETIAAADTLTTALIRGFKGVAEAITGTVNVTRFLGEEFAAARFGPAADDLVRLNERLEDAQRTLAGDQFAEDRFELFGPNGLIEYWNDAELNAEIKRLQGLIADAMENAPPLLAQNRNGALPTGGAGGGGALAPPLLQEIKITVPKIERTELEQFYDELHDLTRTQEEEALSSYFKQKEALDFLWQEGGIKNVEQYDARLEQINDELLPEIEVTAKKIPPIFKKQTEELNEFQKEAARGTQRILSDTILGAIKGETGNVLDAFTDMLDQMVAQAIAADIAGYLFGEEGGGAKGSTGLLDTFFGFLGGLGAGKAGGGPVYPGNVYPVGERGPELFKPRVPGSIIPHHQLARVASGGSVVNQTINVSGTPSLRTARQMALETARQQRIAQTRFG